MSPECVLMELGVVSVTGFVTTVGSIFIPLMCFSHCGLTFQFVLKKLRLL